MKVLSIICRYYFLKSHIISPNRLIDVIYQWNVCLIFNFLLIYFPKVILATQTLCAKAHYFDERMQSFKLANILMCSFDVFGGFEGWKSDKDTFDFELTISGHLHLSIIYYRKKYFPYCLSRNTLCWTFQLPDLLMQHYWVPAKFFCSHGL